VSARKGNEFPQIELSQKQRKADRYQVHRGSKEDLAVDIPTASVPYLS